MYTNVGSAAALGGGGVASLAYTGFNAIALIVAAATLIFAGLALLKLTPRRASR